jgi:hypothetical protein
MQKHSGITKKDFTNTYMLHVFNKNGKSVFAFSVQKRVWGKNREERVDTAFVLILRRNIFHLPFSGHL